MGQWGVRSYENDDADFAIDAGMDRVHGPAYEGHDGRRQPADDRPRSIGSSPTARRWRRPSRTTPPRSTPRGDDWDDEQRLGFAGIVVRHAELGVPVPDDWRLRALSYLRDEAIEWEEATARKLRRDREIELLERQDAR